MAPEVIEQLGATPASDVWSVGCVVIELLEGKPPYHFLDPMPALFRIVQDDCPPIPEGASPVRARSLYGVNLIIWRRLSRISSITVSKKTIICESARRSCSNTHGWYLRRNNWLSSVNPQPADHCQTIITPKLYSASRHGMKR